MICPKCKEEIRDEFTYCPWCGKKQTKTSGPKPLKRPNGHGTVYKLSGRRRKPWVAAHDKVIIGYYVERSEALAALEPFIQRGIPEDFNSTLKDVFERWRAVHYVDLSDKGKEGYETAWERLAPLHDRKMRDLKTIDFQRITDTAMTKTKVPRPLSRSGKEKIKQLASQLCKQAMVDDIISKNYGELIKLEREEKKEKQIFTEPEIELLSKCDDQTAQIILVMIYTGFRINELFAIPRNDVSLAYPNNGVEGPPYIKYLKGGEKTEAGKNRTVPVHPKIHSIISEWYSKNQELLLTSGNGKQLDDHNFRNREYYPLLDRLGIEKKNPHCTRHTFATMEAKAGVRPEVLKRLLGHAKYSTTADIYVHDDLDELVAAINKI